MGRELLLSLLGVTALALAVTHAVVEEKRQDDQNRAVVAFSAGLTQMVNVSEHVNVTYDRVFLNVGAGYDVTTGHFTAPLDGTYTFLYHGLAETSGQLYLDLYKNDQYISSAYAHITNQYAAASNAVVLSLKRGDHVYITGRGTSMLYGDPLEVYTTFSGYLMFFKTS